VSERRPWRLWQILLVTSSLIVLTFFTLVAVGAIAAYLRHGSGRKTVEIVRYRTVASSSSAAEPSSNAAQSPVPPAISSSVDASGSPAVERSRSR